MPWQKQFDADATLVEAMDLFWERGYQSVSMNDLVDHLGVNRASLYATYGNKETLFLRALARYDRVHREQWLQRLAREHSPIESLRTAFAEVATTPANRRHYGCLLVNTVLDFPSAPPNFEIQVSEAFDATQRFFESQLVAAKDSGDLAASVDPAALAAALMALFLGMRVLDRARRTTKSMHPILSQVDRLLSAA